MLSYAGVLLTSILVTADAEATFSPLPERIAQELDYFVGDWVLEGQGARGPMQSSWSIQWAPGRHCLIVEYSRREPGKVIRGNALWGWDIASGEVVYHALFSDPALEHIRATIEKPGVFKGKYTGSLEGKNVSGTCELRKKGPEQWTFKTAGVADSGAGELDVRFTRVTPPDREPGRQGRPTAADYITMQCNYFVGEWTTEVIEGRDAGKTGTWTCRLDETGKAFVETATMDGKPFNQAIGGFDPYEQGMKEMVFFSDGSTATLLYRHPLETLRGSLVGKILRGTMEMNSPDGQKKFLDVTVRPQDKNRSVLFIHEKGDSSKVYVKVLFTRRQG
jgi:hypothetical protein